MKIRSMSDIDFPPLFDMDPPLSDIDFQKCLGSELPLRILGLYLTMSPWMIHVGSAIRVR